MTTRSAPWKSSRPKSASRPSALARTHLGLCGGLLDDQGLAWAFGKAIVRPAHTSAMFVCVDPTQEAYELWVSATWVDPGEWALQHSPVPVR